MHLFDADFTNQSSHWMNSSKMTCKAPGTQPRERCSFVKGRGILYYVFKTVRDARGFWCHCITDQRQKMLEMDVSQYSWNPTSKQTRLSNLVAKTKTKMQKSIVQPVKKVPVEGHDAKTSGAKHWRSSRKGKLKKEIKKVLGCVLAQKANLAGSCSSFCKRCAIYLVLYIALYWRWSAV